MEKGNFRAMVALGLLLALGMSGAALIIGLQVKSIGSGRQVILVKGLAEKTIKADYAEWNIGIRINGPTISEALHKLRAERPALDDFLAKQGFSKTSLTETNESVSPNMEEKETTNGRTIQVQKGYTATQEIKVSAKDLAKVEAANKAALELEANGHPVFYSNPSYLVSNLEDIKMSLIGAATQNAQKRADEFAKNGNVAVGVMRSASQGAFYILAAGANIVSSDYGGAYDKSTMDKLARVVVTIEYNIAR